MIQTLRMTVFFAGKAAAICLDRHSNLAMLSG
jgi:hypothetical protein